MKPLRMALLFCLGIPVLAGSSQASEMQIVGSVTAPGSPTSVVVTLSHLQPIQGYQTVITFDSTLLTFSGVTTAGLDVEQILAPLTAEFFIVLEEELAPGVGLAAQASIFDFLPPFDQQTLPAGIEQGIARYHFLASENAVANTCTTLELTNGQSSSALDNIIVIAGFSETPDRVSGDICFVESSPFLRGDANIDGILDGLTDSIFILQAEFIPGSPQPACMDAADVDDDGDLNGITDVVFLLAYAFLQGPPPPPPGLCGVDPTEDDLICGSHYCP